MTFAVLITGAANFFVLAQDAAPKGDATSAADLDFFEKRVRPLLVQRCFECHSAKAEKLKGGLLLDSREAILTGGDSGPAAVIGDVEKSLLVQAIRFDNKNVQMPPAGKLPEAEIAVLTEWVRRGLPFPASSATKASRRVIDIAEGKKHWAFRRNAHKRQLRQRAGCPARAAGTIKPRMRHNVMHMLRPRQRDQYVYIQQVHHGRRRLRRCHGHRHRA